MPKDDYTVLPKDSVEALREALKGTNPKTETLILLNALPEDLLPYLIRCFRDILGEDGNRLTNPSI